MLILGAHRCLIITKLLLNDLLVSPRVVLRAYPVSQLQADVGNEEDGMHYCVQAYNSNEGLATVASGLRLGDKVTEAHQELQDPNRNDLIKDLHVVGKAGC